MRKLCVFFGLLSFAFTGFCKSDDQKKPPEQLLGVSVDERGITFQVQSRGCTYKGDFQFDVEARLESIGPMLPAFEHHHYITVSRRAADNCEAFVPYGTKVFMSFEELGIRFGKFHVSNPIGGDKTVGGI